MFPISRHRDGSELGSQEMFAADRLLRHTSILAGAGSDKTTLLRRIIEEAALIGIPSLILDTNNDLARLGESWPQKPERFTEEDAAKAAAYFDTIEVVVWTPGISSGRPLTLSVLPDFSSLSDDPDARAIAIEMARITLLPLLGKAVGAIKRGVLADSLRYFAEHGGKRLNDFILLLANLPNGISKIGTAPKLAEEMANQLRTATATNPLLDDNGLLDPQVLFGETEREQAQGKTRLSIIDFSGLTSEESREAFVNQLQMALFTSIKKYPSRTGRLYVLDEAQYFAPSQKSTPCKENTLLLLAHASRGGLGLIFATQAPNSLDPGIVKSCGTHFYGKMGSPRAVRALRELIAMQGGSLDDIAGLSAGDFFFAKERTTRPIKIRPPLCLTHYPEKHSSEEGGISRRREEAAIAADGRVY
jgi:DNA helicase HerA-like ATPase